MSNFAFLATGLRSSRSSCVLPRSNNFLQGPTIRGAVSGRGAFAARRLLATARTPSVVEYLGQPTFTSHPHLMPNREDLVPGITRAEFKQRRKALGSKFPGQSLVFVSAAARKSSHDTEIRFTQDSTFNYLFGFLEPGAVAVLKGGDSGEFFLFCRKADPDREQWDGPRCGFHRAAAAFDAEDAFPLEDLESGVLRNVVGDKAVLVSSDVMFKNHIDLALVGQVERALGEKLQLPASPDGVDKPWRKVLEECDKLRLVKSESELKLIRFAGDVSSFGHMMGMMQARECSTERKLQNEVESGFIELGAEGTFFNSIVAGGPRACTLHYTANDQVLNPSELVLVDAGARLMGSGYGGDITRTYPVNGDFGEAEKEVYQAVLDVQEQVIQTVRAGLTLVDVHSRAFEAFSLHLDRMLGKMDDGDERKKRTRRYFPHGISHFLGLDVHDTPTISKTVPLPVNSVITVEPGLYFPVNDVSLPEYFRGIGVRIEDNVIIGEDRAEIITRRYAPVDPKAPGANRR